MFIKCLAISRLLVSFLNLPFSLFEFLTLKTTSNSFTLNQEKKSLRKIITEKNGELFIKYFLVDKFLYFKKFSRFMGLKHFLLISNRHRGSGQILATLWHFM